MARLKRNFVVKTVDGKAGAIQRALKAVDIEVVSVIEIFKEEVPEPVEPAASEEGAGADQAAGDAAADPA